MSFELVTRWVVTLTIKVYDMVDNATSKFLDALKTLNWIEAENSGYSTFTTIQLHARSPSGKEVRLMMHTYDERRDFNLCVGHRFILTNETKERLHEVWDEVYESAYSNKISKLAKEAEKVKRFKEREQEEINTLLEEF